MQINIFSLMATTAVRSGDFDNAEKLYKEVCGVVQTTRLSRDLDHIIYR